MLSELTFVGTIDDLEHLIEFLDETRKKHTEIIQWRKDNNERFISCHTHYRDMFKNDWNKDMPNIIIVTDPE